MIDPLIAARTYLILTWICLPTDLIVYAESGSL
jgi:hypothetical protein